MDPADADALHARLVAAFFHAPRIVVCEYEVIIGDETLIVSHVELWLWRKVVRGSVTRPGSIKRNEGAPGGAHAMDPAWLHDWSLEDDVGTGYRLSRSGFGGDGFCRDVDVQFGTAAPAEATQLTIVAPTGHRIHVMLR